MVAGLDGNDRVTIGVKMLRAKLLNVKADLERELERQVLDCSVCGRKVHYVGGLGVKARHLGARGTRTTRRAEAHAVTPAEAVDGGHPAIEGDRTMLRPASEGKPVGYLQYWQATERSGGLACSLYRRLAAVGLVLRPLPLGAVFARRAEVDEVTDDPLLDMMAQSGRGLAPGLSPTMKMSMNRRESRA